MTELLCEKMTRSSLNGLACSAQPCAPAPKPGCNQVHVWEHAGNHSPEKFLAQESRERLQCGECLGQVLLREKAPDSPLLSRRPAPDIGAEGRPRLADAAALQHAVHQVPLFLFPPSHAHARARARTHNSMPYLQRAPHLQSALCKERHVCRERIWQCAHISGQ